MDSHFLFLKFPLRSSVWPAESGETGEEEHWPGLEAGLVSHSGTPGRPCFPVCSGGTVPAVFNLALKKARAGTGGRRVLVCVRCKCE